uniref:Zinc finger protein 346 n=1 Tax=Hippocampus comes TaxID=109280 RepID=A0A3Q2Z9H7_HIPCM
MMAVAMDTDQFPYLPSGPDQVNQMIKEHGNLFTDSLCSVCNAVLISESQKLAHYQSKKHGNKVRRYLSIQSENEPETKKFKSLSSVSHDTNNGESDPMKACKMCKMTFTSPVMAQSHYQGKIHAKNLKLKSVDPHTLNWTGSGINHLEDSFALLPLFFTSSPTGCTSSIQEESSSSSSGGGGGGGGNWQRRSRWRQRPRPLLLHLPGVLQQCADGPAALLGQEAQETPGQAGPDEALRQARHSGSVPRRNCHMRRTVLFK